MSTGDLVGVGEAAAALGVSARHARRLADSGQLTWVGRGLLTRDSIDRYLVSARGSRTRAWAEHTAWGAIALLSGRRPDWLGPTQAARLRVTLRELAAPDELVARMRDRASVETFTAHRAALLLLRDSVVQTDWRSLGIIDSTGVELDGYVAAESLTDIIRRLGLRADPVGAIALRATTFDFDQVVGLISASKVVPALDAATALDPRVRGTALRTLSEILEAYR